MNSTGGRVGVTGSLVVMTLAALFLSACGGYNRSGMTITEGAAVGQAEPERGVPPHVAPRLDPATLAQIDDFVVDRMLELDIPGLALGIVSGQSPVHLRGFGVSDDRNRPVTPDTPFFLSALSNTMTATAVLQLVEDEKLDLDEPVQTYLPWFTAASGEPSQITIRSLLHHQSGFSERTGLDNLFNPDTSETALEENVRRLQDVDPENSVGTYEFSNINYDILGLLVQTVADRPFETYIAENVFGPLDMRHSHLFDEPAVADGMTDGFYRWFGSPSSTQMPIFNMPFSRSVIPSMSMMSTVEDLGHFLIAQLNEGEFGGARVLTAASMQLMHTPAMYDPYLGYAMGWHVRPLWDAPVQVENPGSREYRIPTILDHEGTYPTFGSYMAVVPEGQWGLVVLTNTNDQLTGRSVFPYHGLVQLVLGEETTESVNDTPVLIRNLRWILAVVLFLLTLAAAFAVLRLRRWRKSPIGLPEGAGAFSRFVAIPLIIDLTVLTLLVAALISQTDAPVSVALRSAPDAALLVALIVLMALGWGVTRTILTLTTLYRKRAAQGPTFKLFS